jgi:hypothetical protein
MATPTKIAAARAADRLTKALTDTAARGLRHHCADAEVGGLWTSEFEHERAIAAKLCAGCPVHLECWGVAVAYKERFGTWAGVDRIRHPNGKVKVA